MASKESLKRLTAARGLCKSAITKLHNYVSGSEIDNADLESLLVKRERLKKAFSDYESYNIEVRVFDPPDAEDFDENFDEVDDKYCVVLAKLNTLINALQPPGHAAANISLLHDGHERKEGFQRLPRINIKVFTGETCEYIPFINMYTSVVHENQTLSSCEKLYYLTSLLAGEALNVIRHLPLTSDNYTIALNLLKQRYHNNVKIISHHVNSILDIPSIKRANAASFRSLVAQIKQHLGALSNLKQDTQKWDTLLVCILQRKLDFFTIRSFYSERNDTKAMPSLEDLLSFLDNRADALETASPKEAAPDRERKYMCNAAAVADKSAKPKCKYCTNTQHRLYTCKQFKLASVADRNSFVLKHKLCKICLTEHVGKCKFNFRCKQCKGSSHNTLICMNTNDEQSLIGAPPMQVALHCNNNDNEVLLPTAMVAIQCSDGSTVTARAMLDSGSQVSLAREELIKKVNPRKYKDNKTIIGICDGVKGTNERALLTVSSRLHNFTIDVDCCIVDKITVNLPQFQIDREKLNLSNTLKLADQTFDKSAPIDLLLGCNEFFQVLRSPPLPLKEGGQPYLLKTHFGDIIAGAIPAHLVTTPRFSNSVCAHVSQNAQDYSLNELNKNMSKFWTAEKVPEIYAESCSEEESAEITFQTSTTLENNRFSVALPLKQPIGEIELGDSFSAALQRFNNLEHRLSKDSKLYQMYRDFINEYITLGHAEPLDILKHDLEKDGLHFLPHHPVFNEKSPTTKMRTVFDGSFKTKNKVSLNDVLQNGPLVQNELFDILILFRLPKYILLCDIKQMFRQIILHPPYRVFQNILWRESINDSITCLQLKTVTYGLKSSSYLAARCLIELAERFKEKYTLASSVIKTQSYVDDVITGHDDINTLIEIKRQLIELLSLGGFQLHKWGSNDSRLLENIPPNEKSPKDVDMSKDTDFIKTLGLRYNVKSDNLYISCPETEVNEFNTKRQVLSFISRIYDPAGLTGPLVMSLKLFMQRIYQEKLSWDERLPMHLNEKWCSLAKGLGKMSSIEVARHINLKDAVVVELVGFADASKAAYGCCLYLRTVKNDGIAHTNLLCSKSRANSINNELSIPRKELNGSLLLAMLTRRVYNTLKIYHENVKVYLYLDSQIVLAWLNMEPVRLMPYVANRVIKIKKLTESWPWFYVRSQFNPADCLSKGVEPQSLQGNDLWWYGPQFLKETGFKHETAKNEPLSLQQLPELKKRGQNDTNFDEVCNNVSLQNDSHDIFDKYSDLSKLKRIIAYVLRFATNSQLKHKNDKRFGELQPDELENALLKIIKCDQHRQYATEIACIKSNKLIKGPLASLNPFLDGENLLRVGGRLQNSRLTFSQKHPIILVRSSHITMLIIRKEHEKLLHAGPKLLLSAINQKFWLINGISQLKKVIHKCLVCFKLKAKAASQLMGSLPAPRVTPARIFEKTGIDFCGPFYIKMARVRKPMILKIYVLVLVCFFSKALHFEQAGDLTTATFLNCLKRFIARRNKPSHIYCDNAATFKCASSQLQELYKLQATPAHQNAVSRFTSEQGIAFHHVPSYSPEMAGLWEAGVASFKYHLKRVVGKNVLTYEEFNTVIIQIEGILNARPLTTMSSDPTDMSYLTPGHFLTGAPLTSYPESDLTNIPTNRLSFWRQCTQYQQQFFKQWHKSYLNMLQNRPKWKNSTQNVKEGMLVIMRDQNVTPFNWPMGRIVKLFPGKDDKVRAFDVMMPNKHIVRTSIRKICILPLEE